MAITFLTPRGVTKLELRKRMGREGSWGAGVGVFLARDLFGLGPLALCLGVARAAFIASSLRRWGLGPWAFVVGVGVEGRCGGV